MAEGSSQEFVQDSMCKERMVRITEDIKSFNRRLNSYDERLNDIHQLSRLLERLTVTVEQVLRNQDEMRDRLDDIESKDGKMWRDIVKYAITAIIGVIIGFILKQVGIF